MKLLDYSHATMKRRQREGRLTPYRDGLRIVRYRRAEVEALLMPAQPSEAPPPGVEMITREAAQKLTGFSRSTIIRREGNGLTPHRDGKLVTYRLSEVLALAPEARRAAYEAERKTQAEKTRATYAPNPEVQRE